MSIFNRNTEKAKTVINTGRADLRKYTPEALRKIKIINAGVIILPKEATPEFMEAYSRIVKNTGSEKFLSNDENIVTISGISEFNCQNTNIDTLYEISGITVLTNCKTEAPVRVILSGICAYESDNNFQFEELSGISHAVDFKIEHVITFSKDAEINGEFFGELKENTVILCGKNLTFKSDVDKNMLKNRNIYFLAGKDIICPKSIIGIIQTMATAGKEITEDD